MTVRRKGDVLKWDLYCPNTHEGVQTVALLRIAEELYLIRRQLESVGRDGIHEVIRAQRDKLLRPTKRKRAA